VERPFRQVDVFGADPGWGNPVAVVLDATGLTAEQMQLFARWTNLSETTFVLPADVPGADYQVRIFTTTTELPFAGHPTLGTCHAWLEAGGVPASPGQIVQQCAAGLVKIRQPDGLLAFAAPPLIRSGPVDDELVDRIAAQLAIARTEIVDTQWADNGPGWVAVLLRDADQVLALRPAIENLEVGIVGPYPAGAPCAFEVRAFFSLGGDTAEDPVTGSLNASLAQWLLSTGRATAPYVASQGTAIGRRGRVHIFAEDGEIWVAGATSTIVSGLAELPAAP
jgi:PhzF family phenazine biosynthesis protein